MKPRTFSSALERRLFGLLVLLFFVIVGGLLRWKLGTSFGARFAWSIGVGFAGLYYLVPAFRFPLYSTWMASVEPLGKLMSWLIFSSIYFLVVTPIGLLLRLCRRTTLDLAPDPRAETYWVPRNDPTDSKRAFSQY